MRIRGLDRNLRRNGGAQMSLTQRAINILKSAGPGAWYDPSDLTTLFQDSTGTTPVTAVEQPVGRVLDKSGAGNSLIQPTATSRPTLSSRYNLLTKTEQFDDSIWAKTGATVAANATVAPDGSTTADALIEGSGGTFHYVDYISATVGSGIAITASVRLKANGRSWAQVNLGTGQGAFFDLINGVVGTTSGTLLGTSITPLSGGWWLCSVVAVTASAAGRIGVYAATGNGGFNYAGNGTSGLFIWGASLTVSADASLPYQRVNTATDYDYDFSKFPPYLKFDGVDDSLYTSAIDFTSTDKMTVFAGVHKASDAAVGVLVDLSGDPTGASNGSFSFTAPASAASNIRWISRGTVLWAATGSGVPAPATRVAAGIGDISGDVSTLRLNGVQADTSSGDQGTGNYGNYPLYIGRRNNASLPFNGRIYQLAIKGKALSAGEVSTLESYINSKTKAY